MRILGIDPGIQGTGFALIAADQAGLRLEHSGVICPPRQIRENRLKHIYTELCKIVDLYKPEEVALEDTFFAKNARSAFTLGSAHGVTRLAAEMYGLPVAVYMPTAVKMAVVGFGRATKEQVKIMVARILTLSQEIHSEHEADAVAVAICHAHTATGRARSKTLRLRSHLPRAHGRMAWKKQIIQK